MLWRFFVGDSSQAVVVEADVLEVKAAAGLVHVYPGGEVYVDENDVIRRDPAYVVIDCDVVEGGDA